MGRHRIPRDVVEASKIVVDPNALAAPPVEPTPQAPAFDESEVPPPVDNEHVAPGAEPFAADTIEQAKGAGQPGDPHPLRTDGPTLEEFVAAGYEAATYPPPEYARRVTPVEARFRVVRECRVSLNGHITSLCEGKIIDPHCYGGPLIIDVLRAQGAELEEIA